MSGAARVLVATNAFGLGIDKPDTRFVLHYQMPPTLDAYCQESGRAGRDGAPAQCTLLHLGRDRSIQQFFLAGRYPHIEDLEAVHAALLGRPPPAGENGDEAASWTFETLHAALRRPALKLRLALLLMRREGVVRQDRRGRLTLARADLDAGALERLMAAYRERRQRDHDALEGMVFYCQSGLCRWQLLLDHFGEAMPDTEARGAAPASAARCGHCDNCLRQADAQAALERALPEPDEAHGPRPPQAPAPLQPGDPVRVPRYGRGRVLQADATGITVGFANGPDRCFLPAYVRRA